MPVHVFYFQIAGFEGAQTIGQLLESRGVKLAYILDEGLTISEGVVPGAKTPVALFVTFNSIIGQFHN